METDRPTVDLVDAEVIRPFTRAALLAALLGATAYAAIPIPFSPVPVTLQVLVVFLAGIFLGPYWGTLSIVLYLVAGALGAPVFSGGSAGLGHLVGQNAGYLWSYPFATVLIGFVVHRGRELRNPVETSIPILVVTLIIATALIYAMGVAWLAHVLDLGYLEAVSIGAAPFVVGEAFKIAAAVAIVKSGEIVPIRSS